MSVVKYVGAYTTILYTVQTLYFKLTKYSPKTVVKESKIFLYLKRLLVQSQVTFHLKSYLIHNNK